MNIDNKAIRKFRIKMAMHFLSSRRHLLLQPFGRLFGGPLSLYSVRRLGYPAYPY